MLIIGIIILMTVIVRPDPKTRFKKYAHAHAAPSNKAKLVYTVKSGDVIGKIAEKFNVRLSDLKYWNGMTKDRINIGQKITGLRAAK